MSVRDQEGVQCVQDSVWVRRRERDSREVKCKVCYLRCEILLLACLILNKILTRLLLKKRRDPP